MENEGNSSAVESTSNANSGDVSKEVVEAIHLLAQGKRNMMCLEFSQAVQQFQGACEILGKSYGEMADECADAYYWYGKSLLELSRMEGEVVGDAVPAESEDSQSEEDNDNSEEQDATNDGDDSATGDEDSSVLSEDIGDEETEFREEKSIKVKPEETNSEANVRPEGGTNNEASNKIQEGAQVDRKELVDTEATQNQPQHSSENLVNPTQSTSKEENGVEEDEVSNLQLAWEMLELAKVIYSRHNTRDMKLKLADTYLKLGEIGMETEQFDQSISDLTCSLTLLRANLSPEDRHIAETLYQLGLASQFYKSYDSAVQYFTEAVSVLESRIKLQRGIVSGEIQPEIPSESSDGFYSPQELAAREIEEIESIIPDIKSKIEDVADEQRSEERVRTMMNSLSQPSATASSSSSSALQPSSSFSAVAGPSSSSGSSNTKEVPVNNITHLIRKKRKDDDSNDSSGVKRVCTRPMASSSSSSISEISVAGSNSARINGSSACVASSNDSNVNEELSNGGVDK